MADNTIDIADKLPDDAALKATLEQFLDMTTDRLDFLNRAIALGESLTGPDDPRVEELCNMIREEDVQTPPLVKQLKDLLADLGMVVPQPDDAGK